MLEKVEVFGKRIDSRSHWPEFWSRCCLCTEQPAADCFDKTTELSREVCWPWNFCFPTVVIFPTHIIILKFENSAVLQCCFLRRFIVESYHKVWEKTNHYILSFFWRARSLRYLGHNRILNYWKVIKHKHDLNTKLTVVIFWCSELPFPLSKGHFLFLSHFFHFKFQSKCSHFQVDPSLVLCHEFQKLSSWRTALQPQNRKQ